MVLDLVLLWDLVTGYYTEVQEHFVLFVQVFVFVSVSLPR